MMLQMDTDEVSTSKTASADADWPPQVELILSAMETGQFSRKNRRSARRNPFRVRALLRLFSDPEHSTPWTVYTRDVHARGLGFISPHRLPLGYGGVIELPHPDGGLLKLSCTLSRCRETAPGWYEGSVNFNREQPELELRTATVKADDE
jgi:hypothetical protein